MAKKKIMLKAETHYGTIELPMTQAKALSFSKKLHATHKREQTKYSGETRRAYKNPPEGTLKPFIKIEYSEI